MHGRFIQLQNIYYAKINFSRILGWYVINGYSFFDDVAPQPVERRNWHHRRTYHHARMLRNGAGSIPH